MTVYNCKCKYNCKLFIGSNQFYNYSCYLSGIEILKNKFDLPENMEKHYTKIILNILLRKS